MRISKYIQSLLQTNPPTGLNTFLKRLETALVCDPVITEDQWSIISSWISELLEDGKGGKFTTVIEVTNYIHGIASALNSQYPGFRR